MERAGKLLAVALKKMGAGRRFYAESIIIHWPEIVGGEIAAHTRPATLKNGILFVSVSGSAWCHHLTMLKQGIIEKIHLFAGEKVLADIRFQAGYFPFVENDVEETHEAATVTEQARQISLSGREINYARQMTAEVNDAELKRKIASVLLRQQALNLAKSGQKWHSCAVCQVLCPPDETYCTVCKTHIQQKKIAEIRSCLHEAPWLSFSEISPYLSCSEEQYSRARKELLDALMLQVQKVDENDRSGKMMLSSLAMLWTGRKPDELDDGVMKYILSKIRRSRNVPAHRS